MSQIVTPRGKAIWPHIQTPDTRFNDGEWNCKVQLPMSDEVKSQMSMIDDEIEKAKIKFDGKKKAPVPYDVEGDTVIFKIKQKSTVRTKDGGSFDTKVMVVDSKLKPIPSSVNIGDGSEVKVSYKVRPYTAPVGYGVTLSLVGVQVLNLVEYQNTGFGEEDGFTSESVTPVDEANFKTEEVEVQDEDF